MTPLKTRLATRFPPSALGLVFVGGAFGSALREVASLSPFGHEHPLYTILLVNLFGAFVLGVLLDLLAGAGPDTGLRRGLRLAFGTGVCGGFTTYSTFAVQGAQTLNTAPGDALGYGLATLLLGALATAAGIGVAALLRARSGPDELVTEASR